MISYANHPNKMYLYTYLNYCEFLFLETKNNPNPKILIVRLHISWTFNYNITQIIMYTI